MTRILEDEKIGSFRIVEKIGEGGMAIIYKAIQPSLNRTVVIKKLKDPNREIIERFKKEAYVSATFSQANVLAIYDFIFYSKSYYLVMEYIDGKNLRSIIDYAAPISPRIASLIVREIACGLEYIHSKGITHRDIKPSNIILSYKGDVKLIDFGVAKDETPSKLTVTGMIVGTPSYMSPEQANGDKITIQSDIYSLGVLLYELVTGRKPFSGDTNTELLMKIIKGKFPSPRKYNQDLSWRLLRIIKKCMHRDLDKRYNTAAELIHDLDLFIPWKGHSNKAELLTDFLRKYESSEEISMSDLVNPTEIHTKKTIRFWFNTLIMLMICIFALFKLNQFFKDERLSRLSVQTNIPNSKVYLNNHYLGNVNGNKAIFYNIPSGNYIIKIISPEGNGAFISNIKSIPQAESSVIARIPLTNAKSRISLQTSPKNAIIFLNGHNCGDSPILDSTIVSGKYKITFVKEGFETYTTEIELESGQNYILNIMLQKK